MAAQPLRTRRSRRAPGRSSLVCWSLALRRRLLEPRPSGAGWTFGPDALELAIRGRGGSGWFSRRARGCPRAVAVLRPAG